MKVFTILYQYAGDSASTYALLEPERHATEDHWIFKDDTYVPLGPWQEIEYQTFAQADINERHVKLLREKQSTLRAETAKKMQQIDEKISKFMAITHEPEESDALA